MRYKITKIRQVIQTGRNKDLSRTLEKYLRTEFARFMSNEKKTFIISVNKF